MHYSNVINPGNKLYIPPHIKESESQNKTGVANRNNVSFTSGALVKTLSTLESNPVLALATIDLCGMIMPRTLIDIQRNKEELGHLNWDAGRETLMREVFSSSLMFFGPGVVFNYWGDKLLNSKLNPFRVNTKAFTNYQTLDIINTKAAEILKNKTGLVDINAFRQELAASILKDVKGATSGRALSPEIIKEITEEIGRTTGRANIDKTVSEYLTKHLQHEYDHVFNKAKEALLKKAGSAADEKAIIQKAKDIAYKKVFSKTEKGLRKSLINGHADGVHSFIGKIIGKVRTHVQEASGVIAGKGYKAVGTTHENIIRDVFSATDDIALKAANLSKGNSTKIAAEELQKNIDTISKATRKLKISKAILPFAVVFTLLVTFPKFSAWLTKKLNGGKDEFPGLTGLTKEKSEDKVTLQGNKAQQQSPKANHAIPAMQPQAMPAPVVVQTPQSSPLNQSDDPFAWFERRMNS